MQDELQEFYKKNGISAADFACSSKDWCESAVQAAKGTFTPAREVQFGDLYLTSRPRIVVVSLDPGSQFYQDKGRYAGPDELQMQIRGAVPESDPWKKNRHWYRTHEGVAAMVQAMTEQVISPHEAARWFAHTSVVRCCANLPNAREAPWQMYWACRRYLEDELAILRPDIIWSQGARVLDAMSWIAPWLPKGTAVGVAKEVPCPWGPVLWVHTEHPSAPTVWGNEAWGNVLALMKTLS